MNGLKKEQGHDLFENMLQAERSREIGSFANSRMTMYLHQLKETIEAKITPTKAGLRFKSLRRVQ